MDYFLLGSACSSNKAIVHPEDNTPMKSESYLNDLFHRKDVTTYHKGRSKSADSIAGQLFKVALGHTTTIPVTVVIHKIQSIV